ncbi:hypothetical protein Bbelb_055010 [Branchiostoma belcheri]|nr:hypothetical protein Bbelb_055010 [Branchiostoma belcheri]
MKMSVCLLFLGCLVLTAAFPAPREEDLQGLLTKLGDLVDELKEVRMEKRVETYEQCKQNCEGKGEQQFKDECKLSCDYEHGKLGKREQLETEKEELQEGAFFA